MNRDPESVSGFAFKALNKPSGPLSPDPDNQNEERAEWAELSLQAFQNRTRTDSEDALSDLLCDLRHWADRRGIDWYAELAHAMRHYADETNGVFEFQTNQPPATSSIVNPQS